MWLLTFWLLWGDETVTAFWLFWLLAMHQFPTLLLALPVVILAVLDAALDLLRDTIDLSRLQKACFEARPILEGTLLTWDWIRTRWRRWWMIWVAFLLTVLMAVLVVLVALITAERLVMMLWDEAVLQASKIALSADEARHRVF